MEIMNIIILLIFVVVGIVLYFLPTEIAYMRGRINKGAIFCLNFFLGWTFVGWVVAMVWAVKESGNGAE